MTKTPGKMGGMIRQKLAALAALLWSECPGGRRQNVIPAAGRCLGFLQSVVPLVEQSSDVAEAEVDVRQVVTEVDRLLEFARVGRPGGELEEDLLATLFLVR